MNLLGSVPIQAAVPAVALIFFMLIFLLWFLTPAVAQSWRLSQAIRQFRKTESKDKEVLGDVFKRDRILSAAWKEFKDTLHQPKELDGTGTWRPGAQVWSTVPAEMFFSEQVLVNTPVRTEFFKHLPGIFTGIGIIGTFWGLIIGLQAFQVSDSPQVARDSLNGLVNGVYHAFEISGSAIFLAIIVTSIEKWLVTGLYRQVERLCQEIDARFESGAGEEYLHRLVNASEASAKEARQLKQSLVNDLKEILQNLTERQIQAQHDSSAAIAERIVGGLNESLRGPLSDIGEAVKQVSSSQGDAVNRLLTDTMSAFISKINDLFAGQIDGMRGLQQQAVDSLAATVGQLEKMVSDISSKGQQTTETMSSQVAAALVSMEERQRALNEQSQALLDSIRSQNAQAQQDASKSMQEAVDRMTASVAQVTEALGANIESAAARDEQRTRTLTEHTAATTGNLSTITQELIKRTGEAVVTMRQAVEAMRTGTSETVTKMNMGAADMLKAASEMAQAGRETGTALQRAQALSEQLSKASGALTTSGTQLSRAIDDYKATRDTLAAMIEQLRATVDSAKREASLTADILQRIEQSAQRLREAEDNANDYLKGVSAVLQEAHNQFGTQVISTLERVNGQFHADLDRATRALSSAIDELGNVLDKVGVQ